MVFDEKTCEALFREAAESVAPEVAEALRAWDEHRTRLYLLRGLPCPLCRPVPRRPLPLLEWTGVSLACPHGHGWSNPDALRADLRPPRGRTGLNGAGG